jgi:hypothetical protein
MQRHHAGNFAVAAILAIGAAEVAADQGRGGPGGPQFGFAQGEQQVLSRFDKDGDQKLNSTERQAALEFLSTQGGGGGRGGRGGRGFMADMGPVTAGPTIDPASVKPVPATTNLYDAGTVRTFFITFEDANWEKQLMAFKTTDIEVPATLVVDGKTYKDVGVKFAAPRRS